MATKRVDGPTPNGGAYSIAYYQDAKGNDADVDKATNMLIVEYSSDGQVIRNTYGLTKLGAEKAKEPE